MKLLQRLGAWFTGGASGKPLRARDGDREPTEAEELMDAVQDGGVGFFSCLFAADRMVWTPGQCKLFGIETSPGGSMRQWYDCIQAQDRDRIEREIWTACALRRDRATLEYGVLRGDGGVRWLASRVVLRYDTEGRAARMDGVTLDLTEQKILDSTMQASARAKDQHLSQLGHELRTPLGAICAAVDVLQVAEPGTPDASDARDILVRQSRILTRVVGDVLRACRDGDDGSGSGLANSASTDSASADPGQILPPSRRRQVLVIEDDDDLMATLRSRLELEGHSVSTAADGVEGLVRLLKLKPEISIVDVGLPGLTGLELARHARAAGYAGRMIACAGQGEQPDVQAALVAGFDACLFGPVDASSLRNSLNAD